MVIIAKHTHKDNGEGRWGLWGGWVMGYEKIENPRADASTRKPVLCSLIFFYILKWQS